jgi:hypothetical protein
MTRSACLENRLKYRLSTRISLSEVCRNPACHHPFSMHHALLGCTYEKHHFGRNGFCQCDGFVASEWGKPHGG